MISLQNALLHLYEILERVVSRQTYSQYATYEDKMKITSYIICFDSLHTTFNDDTHILLIFTVLFLSTDTDYKMTFSFLPF
jgi:hypothetical protein